MSTLAIPSPAPLATPPLVSPEELLTMPDGDFFELVDGVLVERNMSARSSSVAARLTFYLLQFVGIPPRGWVLEGDSSYQCFPDRPRLVRKPDVSFVRLGRFPDEELPEGHLRIPPDLAVEVLSPTDLVLESDEKISEYLDAGVRLVWVVHPRLRAVLIYRADGSIAGVRDDGELDGEDVLPGFKCPVRDLFLMPTPAPAATA